MNCHKNVFLDFITRKKCYNKNDIQDEKVEPCTNYSQCCPYPCLFDVFVEWSNQLEQQSLKSYHKYLVTTTKYTTSTETSMKKKSNVKFSKAPEPMLNGNFDYSNETLHSLNSENEDMELNQTQNYSLSCDTENPRPAIPIGPHFQAEVPKWKDSTSVRCHNNDDLKWIGVQVWPMPNINKNNAKDIGEGRPESCYCENS